MSATQEPAAQEHAETQAIGVATGRHHRVTMPSARHSVLAVEQRRSTSAEYAALADLGEALSDPIDPRATAGAPGLFDDADEPPSAAGMPRSRDIHAPSPANADRLGTVFEEHR